MNPLFCIIDDMLEISIGRRDLAYSEDAINELNTFVESMGPQHMIEAVDKPFVHAYFMKSDMEKYIDNFSEQKLFAYTVIDTIYNDSIVIDIL